MRRAQQHLAILRGARILWVDDQPENNLNERQMFSRLGVEVDVARTTDEGLMMLRNDNHDVVFSDMLRDGDSRAGLMLLESLPDRDKSRRVISYVGIYDSARGIPAGAFGMTNKPDELLHLTLDALERERA